jgi:aryl-alcohol dehydrogenase
MLIKAAVVRERSGPFAIETVELCEPRPDEVIVRVVASGMCQTDLHGRDGYFDSPYPAVYGHEGAGVVHAVGNAVRALAPGDHVVMSYPWCGGCANCQQQRQNYCVHGRSLKSGGTRADGSTLLAKNGAPVYSAFFQQSSFGTFALSQERYTVKVRSDAPLELLGPLACSGHTGAGAVLNVMKPKPGESIAICDVVGEIRKLSGGGVRHSIETSAVPAVFREAIECLMPAGTCVLLGSARRGSEASFEMPFLQQGRTVRGVVQGDSVPQEFIPKLVDLIMAKKFPIERMIKFYDFADINLAARESSAGITIKPVLRMSA